MADKCPFISLDSFQAPIICVNGMCNVAACSCSNDGDGAVRIPLEVDDTFSAAKGVSVSGFINDWPLEHFNVRRGGKQVSDVADNDRQEIRLAHNCRRMICTSGDSAVNTSDMPMPLRDTVCAKSDRHSMCAKKHEWHITCFFSVPVILAAVLFSDHFS